MFAEIGKTQLMHELLITLMAEVVAIVNARPISALSLACEQAPSWRQGQQKFGAKRRASGACTHVPKSQLPPTRRTACQLSSFNQSARAESQNPQQTKNDTREILVFALLFSRKNSLWLKSRDTKPRTITAKLRSSEGHAKE